MNTVTSERQFHAAIFQHKMEQSEIEREITRLEKKFKKIDKYGNISAWFDLQDELGVMYNRLMKIQRIKNGR
jgi:hypothetical protein